MRCTLLLPGSLVPDAVASEVIAALNAPALAARLQRATLVSEQTVDEAFVGAADLAWLWHELAGASRIATAPYALLDLEGNPPAQQVWRADPVHLSAARDHIILVPLDDDPLSDSDATALLAAANEACSHYRCRLFRAGPAWFLQPETPWTLDTAPIETVAYRALLPQLPTSLAKDSDARRWLHLQTELQMLWHQHAVNEAREAAGQAIANSVWLHGGGNWRPLAPTRFARVHADDAATRGLARAAGAGVAESQAAATDNTLIVLRHAFAPLRRDAWDEWLAAMAAIDTWIGALPADTSLDIVLAGATRVRRYAEAPGDRWRVWRNSQPRTLFAEPPAA